MATWTLIVWACDMSRLSCFAWWHSWDNKVHQSFRTSYSVSNLRTFRVLSQKIDALIVWYFYQQRRVAFLWSSICMYQAHAFTLELRVLTRLVLKHLQAFSDCLQRGFLMLMYCDLLKRVYFWISKMCLNSWLYVS